MSEQQAGADGAGTSTNTEKTLTQSEVNAILSRERKSFEAKYAGAATETVSKLQAELDALKAQHEDAGKNAVEKAQAVAARERAQFEARLADREKTIAERDGLVKARDTELRDTRLESELSTLLAGAKTLPSMLRFAALGFRTDAAIEYADDGKVSGVDVGPKRFASVKEAFDDWMRANGANFVAAPAGGGTRTGNGVPAGKSLADLSRSELIRIGNQQRAAKR